MYVLCKRTRCKLRVRQLDKSFGVGVTCDGPSALLVPCATLLIGRNSSWNRLGLAPHHDVIVTAWALVFDWHRLGELHLRLLYTMEATRSQRLSGAYFTAVPASAKERRSGQYRAVHCGSLGSDAIDVR